MKILKLQPKWDSNLAALVVELENLRNLKLTGSTDFFIFTQLQKILTRFESLGSARIEGNRTTISEFVEKIIAEQKLEIGNVNVKNLDEKMLEIINIEKATAYTEEYIKSGQNINRVFLSNVHKIIVEGLSVDKEGSATPGEYRKIAVSITGSILKTPDYAQVDLMMEELFLEINNSDIKLQNQLILSAQAHHLFTHIHPFTNGNGRTVRLLTYAMLLKFGFTIIEKVINPVAVFCNNRNEYYNFLSQADTGTEDGVEVWCEYVLGGLKTEFEKIKKLTNIEFANSQILFPALKSALEINLVSQLEFKILEQAVFLGKFKNASLTKLNLGISTSRTSQILTIMKNNNLILEVSRHVYVINLSGPILRMVVKIMEEKNFLPVRDVVQNLNM